jgi:hypothetical protein
MHEGLKVTKVFMRNWQKKVKKQLGAFFIIIIMASCGADEEGCLDIQGTNFDVSSDIACSDCCTFPTLSMRINHVKDDSLTFSLDEAYLDANNTPFVVNSVQFYVSELELVRSNGETATISDEITVTLNDNSAIDLTDNVELYIKNIGTYTEEDFGEVKVTGTFTKIRFYVGLNNPTNQVLPASVTSEHPLAAQTESMYWNTTDGYIFNKIGVQTDTADATITTYEIGTDGNQVLVELDYPLNISSGFDVDLNVNLDYGKLLEGINFQLDDAATVISKIIGNTADSFSVTE